MTTTRKPKAKGQSGGDDAIQALLTAFARDPSVALGGTMGSNALTVEGRIFAMRTNSGQLVYKLPRPRIEALIAAGQGQPWGPGGKRVMKEWVELIEGSTDQVALAREARTFVATPKRS